MSTPDETPLPPPEVHDAPLSFDAADVPVVTRSCPNCQRSMLEDDVVCPHCGKSSTAIDARRQAMTRGATAILMVWIAWKVMEFLIAATG